MSNFWVIDTKCKVLPESVLPQDGSAYYFGRSVVPAESKEIALEKLVSLLKEQDVLVESVLETTLYKHGLWEDSDDFEVPLGFERAKNLNSIEIGCLVSEKSKASSKQKVQ